MTIIQKWTQVSKLLKYFIKIYFVQMYVHPLDSLNNLYHKAGGLSGAGFTEICPIIHS